MPEPVTQETEKQEVKQEPSDEKKEETVAIPKKELERLQKQDKFASSKAWDIRHTEKTIAELKSALAAKEEELAVLPPGDTDIPQLRKQIATKERELAQREQALAEKETKETLKNAAFRWADELGIEASQLADCKSEVEVELKARRLHSEQVKAHAQTPSKGVDTGGRKPVEQKTWTEIMKAYADNPTDPKIRAAYRDARRERGM